MNANTFIYAYMKVHYDYMEVKRYLVDPSTALGMTPLSEVK